MTILVFLGSLLGAMALGVPIAFALLICGVALMWHLALFDPQILAQNLINGADSFPLLAVPFFMLAGEIMNVGGLSRRIVNLALAVVGHIRGGLGYVTIIAACLLAALSGSAMADAAALTALLLPMMVAAGHDKARSAGLIASAGIIAPIIPPSIGFVVFGVAANVSISKLFMAGIVPGLMLGASLWVTWWWLARQRKFLATGTQESCGRVDGVSSGVVGTRSAVHHHRRIEDGRLHADRSCGRRCRLCALRHDCRASGIEAVTALSGVCFLGQDQRDRDVPGCGFDGQRVADHRGWLACSWSSAWSSRSWTARRC